MKKQVLPDSQENDHSDYDDFIEKIHDPEPAGLKKVPTTFPTAQVSGKICSQGIEKLTLS